MNRARIRTGTDTAFFGGLINYVLEKNLIHHEYVKNYTNASFIVKQGFGFSEGLFSGYDPVKRIYDTSTWGYEGDAPAQAAFERAQKEIIAGGQGPAGAGAGVALAKRDMQLEHPRSVFQLLKAHYSRYTPEMVASITGIPADQFLEIADNRASGDIELAGQRRDIRTLTGLADHFANFILTTEAVC